MIIPTLMYHSVAEESTDYLTVSLAVFKQQIAGLSAYYNIVSVRKALGFTDEKPAERRPVVITFDDAFLDNYLFALPVLTEHGAKAAFFVPAAYLGKNNRWDHKAPRIVKHMEESQIGELFRLGHEIGSHTMTHQRITKLTQKEMEREYSESIRILKGITGEAPRILAYPYGASDALSASLAGRYFDAAFTTVREGVFDWNSNRNQIRRIYVSPEDTPESLTQKIQCYQKGIQHG